MFEDVDRTAQNLYRGTGSLLNGIWDHTAQTWSDALHGNGTVGQYLECGAEAVGVTALVAYGGYRGVSQCGSAQQGRIDDANPCWIW